MFREILSMGVTVTLIGILLLALCEGWVFVSDVSSALAYVLIGSMVGILIWGFKPRIERTFRKKSKAQPQELAKAIAEEAQKLKEKEVRNEKHTSLIYNEIVRLLGKYSEFVAQLGDWLSCFDPNKFPKELAPHLEAYNALSIATSAKELCKSFNTDFEKAINDIIIEFTELVEKLAEKEHADGKKFSLQRYDIIPNPDHYYSPDILAWNIYHNAGRFQPYTIEPIQRDGWFKIGNTVAQTDNRIELESFTKLANEYSLRKTELFKKFYDRRIEAIDKIKEFFDALREIKKKLDSGHHLEGKCYLCLNCASES